MTDTAKSNILKYISGKIVPEPIVDEPQFLETVEITNDLDTYLSEQFEEGYVINGTLQNTNSNITFMYGGFDNGISWQGFIIVLNYDLTPIQTITEYSTGTNLGIIYVLNVDENGLYYGIEHTTSQKFIMLNNIGVKNPQVGEYEVKLRKSYILPDELNLKDNYRVKKINKIFGQSRYVFVAYNANFIDGTDDLSVAELKINVGIANEWTYYSYETGKYDTRIKDSYAVAEEDDSLYFKVIVIEEGQYIEYTRNGISITRTAFTPTFDSSKSVDAILISKTESYVAVTELLGRRYTNK